MPKNIFTDDDLLFHLNENDIPYKADDNGLITIDPDHKVFLLTKEPIQLNKLKSCGDIYVYETIKFSASALKESGEIDALCAKEVSLPALESAMGIFRNYPGIDARNATKINVPKLKFTKSILAYSVHSLSLPVLENCDNIDVRRAKSLSAPKLKSCKTIHSEELTDLDIPALESCHIINTKNLSNFSAPKLKIARGIYVHGAKTFSAPVIEECNTIEAFNIEEFSTPILKKSLFIMLSKKIANQKQGPLLFSEPLNVGHISFFNENTQMVKVFGKNFMDLNKAKSFICDRYAQDNNTREEYLGFFKKCEPSAKL